MSAAPWWGLWSPDAVASEWVKIEAAKGRARHILIPVLIAPAEIPFGYDHLHAADLTVWRSGSRALEFNELVSAIESLVPRSPRTLGSDQTSVPGPSTPDHPAGVSATADSDARAAREAASRGFPKRQGPDLDRMLPPLSTALERSMRRRLTLAVPVLLVAGLMMALAIYLLYRPTVPAAPNSTKVLSQGASKKETSPSTTPAAPVATPQAPPRTPGPSDRSSSTVVTPRSSAVGRSTTPVSGGPSGNAGTTRGTTVSFRSDAWNLPNEPLLGFVEIPAGPFLMGSDKSKDTRAAADEFWSKTGGQGKIELPTYYLSRNEATVAQFKAYADATGTQPGDVRSVQGPGDHPVQYVS